METSYSSRRPHARHREPPDRRLFDRVASRYQPLQEAGCGAVMLVHLARDTQEGGNVALKRLRSDKLNNKDALHALMTEAAALSLVHHPGVPVLYSHSLSAPEPYIAEEYVQGTAFSRENMADIAAVVRISVAICGIISALHEAGIVHRDLKPSNIVLRYDGARASLLDYGFSRVPGVEDYVMRVNIPVGTPMFMAPEQTLARAAIDRRADIYSLGLITYVMLSGHYPYTIRSGRTENEEYFRAHRAGKAQMLHERWPHIPFRLSRAVAQAMEKMPEKRFQSAMDFADALTG